MENMSIRDKGIAAAVAVVLLVAIISLFRMYSGSQVHVVKRIENPPGFSEKAQAMKHKGESGTGVDDSPSDHIDPAKMRGGQ